MDAQEGREGEQSDEPLNKLLAALLVVVAHPPTYTLNNCCYTRATVGEKQPMKPRGFGWRDSTHGPRAAQLDSFLVTASSVAVFRRRRRRRSCRRDRLGTGCSQLLLIPGTSSREELCVS